MRPLTLHEAFWAHVRPETGEGCWLWSGPRDRGGYGLAYSVSITPRRRDVRAHRLSWEIHYGEIPDGMCVCHRCDTPSCVRPDHLFLGTALDNARDRQSKGRGFIVPSGEKHPNRRFTAEQVARIRAAYAAGSTKKSLARAYGMSSANIRSIVTGRTWKVAP